MYLKRTISSTLSRSTGRGSLGDWLYGEGDRFDDVFTQMGTEPAIAPVTFLLALSIVKLCIIARGADDVSPQLVPEQELIVDRYFDAIHRRTPSALPALIKRAPLHSVPLRCSRGFAVRRRRTSCCRAAVGC